MNQEYKFLVQHRIIVTDPEIFESGSDNLGVYDTLEQAQDGIRNEFKFQEEHSKDAWKNEGIVYKTNNLNFDTEIKDPTSEIELTMRERSASVSFTGNKNKWMWMYDIFEVPYNKKFN